MSEFNFKEIDNEGAETLDVISHADNLNRWFYETIKPFCKGNILEIGSGIGNVSQFFLNENNTITLSDIRDSYCYALKSKFGDRKTLKGIVNIDLVAEDFETKYSDLLATFDTVFALNVVEHIKDDVAAIANCKKLLKKEGNLIILVPAYQSLYNTFDEVLEHYRRYNKKTLKELFTQNNIKVIHGQYYNFIGIFGWFVSGKLQKHKTIPKGQMSFYNSLVWLFRIVDKLVFNKIGLSVIVVGTKP